MFTASESSDDDDDDARLVVQTNVFWRILSIHNDTTYTLCSRKLYLNKIFVRFSALLPPKHIYN